MTKRRIKCIKPDHQAKDLKNPFYRKKNESTKGKGWWMIGVFIVLAGLTWFFLATPFFKLKNIEISGLERLSDDELRQIIEEKESKSVFLIFKQSNFFLFDREELEEEIMAKYNFSRINVKKSLPDTLKIELSERPYAFIFQEGDNLYYASKDGYIIKDEPVSDEDKTKYFILENKSKIVSINSNLNTCPFISFFVCSLRNLPKGFALSSYLSRLTSIVPSFENSLTLSKLCKI